MKQSTTYVGIDAHKKDLFIAMLSGTQSTPVTWQLANEPNAVRRLVRKLERDAPGPVRVFYEAGPCGYALQHHQPRRLALPRVPHRHDPANGLSCRHRRHCLSHGHGSLWHTALHRHEAGKCVISN